jgi:hypothetical protein
MTNGNGAPRWQTIVTILTAFIIGLLPFIITIGRNATKQELNIIADRQQEVLQRLAAADEHTQTDKERYASLLAQINALESRTTALELRTQALELQTPTHIRAP